MAPKKTFRRMAVLEFLEENGDTSSAEIRGAVYDQPKRPSTVWQAMAKMASAGLVEKTTATGQGVMAMWRITDAGADLLDEQRQMKKSPMLTDTRFEIIDLMQYRMMTTGEVCTEFIGADDLDSRKYVIGVLERMWRAGLVEKMAINNGRRNALGWRLTSEGRKYICKRNEVEK